MQCKEKLQLIYLVERLTNFTIYHNKPTGRIHETNKNTIRLTLHWIINLFLSMSSVATMP